MPLLPPSPTVSALLSMVEFLSTCRPAAIKEAVQCLLAVLSLRPAARVEARVRLQLGLLLYHHSECASEAREHLEKAVRGERGRGRGGKEERRRDGGVGQFE